MCWRSWTNSGARSCSSRRTRVTSTSFTLRASAPVSNRSAKIWWERSENWGNFPAGSPTTQMSMLSRSLVSFYRIRLFSRRATARASSFTTSSGDPKISTFLTWIRWSLIESTWKMISIYLSSVEQWSLTKAAYSALVVATKIMFAVTGWWST